MRTGYPPVPQRALDRRQQERQRLAGARARPPEHVPAAPRRLEGAVLYFGHVRQPELVRHGVEGGGVQSGDGGEGVGVASSQGVGVVVVVVVGIGGDADNYDE